LFGIITEINDSNYFLLTLRKNKTESPGIREMCQDIRKPILKIETIVMYVIQQETV
jgi:hypothetical protein